MKKILTLLVLTALVLALPARADDAGSSTATSATTSAGKKGRLDWPHTFGGQPDFEFTRAEVLNERAKAQTVEGGVAAPAPSLQDLLEDKPLDPLDLTGAATVSGSTVSGTQPDEADVPSLLNGDKAMIKNAELASLTTPQLSDMSDFNNGLMQALNDYMAQWQPDLARYSLDDMVKGLKLQTVSTSPLKYAVINGQKFSEGDRMELPVTLGPSDVDLIDLLQKRIPPAGSMPDDQLQKYKDAVDDAVQQLAADRQKNPAHYQQTLSVPVAVLTIESRRVVILLNNRRQELTAGLPR